MTSLRNAEIGIEINLPTKYVGLILTPIDENTKIPEDTTPYPYHTTCRRCNCTIDAPYEIPEEIDDYLFGYPYDTAGRGSPERVSPIWDWLCDKCYMDCFGVHQHTWSFQTKQHLHLRASLEWAAKNSQKAAN